MAPSGSSFCSRRFPLFPWRSRYRQGGSILSVPPMHARKRRELPIRVVTERSFSASRLLPAHPRFASNPETSGTYALAYRDVHGRWRDCSG